MKVSSTKLNHLKKRPICAVACLCLMAKLRGHETGINYVDTQKSNNCVFEETITMRVLNPLLYYDCRPVNHFINYCLVKSLITGENYDDWAKSFPNKVKVDQHLGHFWHPNRFQWMPRWTLHLSAFSGESRIPNLSQTTFNCLLRKTATISHERIEILSGIICMWSNILSTECEYHTH